MSWLEVHEFRNRILKSLGVERFPMVGTPAWCELPDEHPVKLAAVIDAAQHWALRVDTCQEASAHAAQAISSAEHWGRVGKRIREHADWLDAHPWARRATA